MSNNNLFWGARSGATNKLFGTSTSRNHFENYFQQMQWKPTKAGNSGKTGWKAKRKDYANKKLRRRGY